MKASWDGPRHKGRRPVKLEGSAGYAPTLGEACGCPRRLSHLGLHGYASRRGPRPLQSARSIAKFRPARGRRWGPCRGGDPMRTISALGLSMVLLSAVGSVLAAETANPSPEMASLTKALAGTWAVEDTFAPLGDNQDSIATPKGGRGHGVQVWRSGPGGFT